jgi:hypothetical protein
MSEQAREKSKRGPILTFLLAFIFFGYSLLGWGVFESRLTLTNFLVLFIIFFWNLVLEGALWQGETAPLRC